MTTPDRHAQKQVLLARIAFERLELRRDMARVRASAGLPQLLRALIGGGLGSALGGALSGGAGRGAVAWLGIARALLRRYRFAAALLGAGAGVLKGRGGWRRVVRVAVIGAAAWLGWRVVQGRSGVEDEARREQ
jgi:hypothetical protein